MRMRLTGLTKQRIAPLSCPTFAVWLLFLVAVSSAHVSCGFDMQVESHILKQYGA